MRYRRSAALGAVLLAFFLGCTDQGEATGAVRAELEISEAPPSDPIRAETKPIPFTYRYQDGLELAITEITNGEFGLFPATDDPNAKKGDPYTIVTVTVYNGTHDRFQTAVQGELRYGPQRRIAHRMLLRDDASVAELWPGWTSPPYDMGFLVPVRYRRDVVLQIGVDTGQHEPALFTGPLNTS